MLTIRSYSLCPTLPPDEHLETYLETFCKETRPDMSRYSDTLSHLRTPLLLALWISPLSLLTSNTLVAKKVNKQLLLELFVAFGDARPPLLRRVEHTIWRTLFLIAKDSYDPIRALAVLIQELPWEDLECMQENSMEWRWFDLG